MNFNKIKQFLDDILSKYKKLETKLLIPIKKELDEIMIAHNLKTLQEAAYLVQNGEKYKCKICSKNKKFKGFYQGYGEFCSCKCSNLYKSKDKTINAKISESISKLNQSRDNTFWIQRTKKHKETVKNRSVEKQQEISKKCSEHALKMHEKRTEHQKQEINKKISKSVKNSEKAKKQRKERSKLGGLKMKEIRNNMLEEELKEFCKRYGSPKIDDNEKELYKQYQKLVWKFTNRNLHLVKNIELRGMKYNLDHKFSICEGFKDGISPEIIGSIHNLEIISKKDNCSKQHKCSISKEELLKLFFGY